MKQTTRARRRTENNGHGRSEPPPPPEAPVLEQARELDTIFKSMARKVLVDDDPAAELPLRQFRVCMALSEGPRSMSELSRELGVSQSAVTQIADRLQAAGLVNRAPDDDDRRVRSLQLTPRARKMMQLRQQRRIERMMRVLEQMPAADRQHVLTAMAALRDAARSV